MEKERLIKEINKAINDCIDEFKSEDLHYDDDTLTSLEVSLEDARLIVKALKRMKD